MDLENAIKKGDYSLVRNLVFNKKLTANAESYSLLELALIKENFDIFELLLECGALNVESAESSGQNTLLHYIASLKNNLSDIESEQKVVGVTRLLLTKYNLNVWSVNEKSETPIHVAAKCGNLYIFNIFLDKLMKNLANIKLKNIIDKDNFSLFHAICMGRNSNYVAIFLARVPSVSINHALSANSKWCPEYNALHFAAAYYRYETLNLLIEHGGEAYVNVKTTKNLSALHLACQMNEPNTEWLFCEMSESLVISRGLDGWLSSFCKNLEAFLKNRLEMVKMLLDKLDVDTRNREISIVLRFAKQNNCCDSFVAFVKKQIPKIYEVSEYFEKMMVFDDDEALTEIRDYFKVFAKARLSLITLLMKYYQTTNDDFGLGV